MHPVFNCTPSGCVSNPIFPGGLQQTHRRGCPPSEPLVLDKLFSWVLLDWTRKQALATPQAPCWLPVPRFSYVWSVLACPPDGARLSFHGSPLSSSQSILTGASPVACIMSLSGEGLCFTGEAGNTIPALPTPVYPLRAHWDDGRKLESGERGPVRTKPVREWGRR